MPVALIETQGSGCDGRSLDVDHFGLSIGAVSVGIPPARTADDVYRRYLDLMQILQRGRGDIIAAPPDHLAALAQATGVDPGFIRRRLAALQAAQPG
jgi:hypothetical protein